MNTHDDHRAVWDAIPWVVNGSAGAADRERVLAHAAVCADCRAELDFHRTLLAGARAAEAPRDPAAAFQRLLARIEIEDAGARPVSAPPRWARWLVAAALLQAVGLVLLAGRSWQQPAAYETLSNAGAPQGVARIRLVAAPTLSVGALQTLLARAGLVIAGASAEGVFALAPRDGVAFDRERALALLRAERGVLLAEPIGAP